MFERVDTARTDRSPLLQPWGIWASAATHLALAAGISAIPPRTAPVPESVEWATFLALPGPQLVPAASHAPAVPAPRKAAHAAATTRGEGPRDEEREPTPAAAPLPDLTPAATARALPEVLRGLPLSMAAGIRGGGPTPGTDALSRSGAEESGAGQVVDAETLGEMPKLLNEGEVVRLLGDLYPDHMKDQGIHGPAEVNFIVGTNGRVEAGSVQVIRLPHPDFLTPTLRGIAMMRFRPARVGGVRVRVRVTVPVAWRLREGE